MGDYYMDVAWLGKECRKFELVAFNDWPQVMLFTIQEKEIPVPLVTDDRSASKKLYLVCPYCAKQRQHLYAAKSTFSCGGCLGLSYATQSMRPQERLARRIRKLRLKIWGYDWPDKNDLTELSYHWQKPKQLHRTTFDRERMLLSVLERKYWEDSSIVSDIKVLLSQY